MLRRIHKMSSMVSRVNATVVLEANGHKGDQIHRPPRDTSVLCNHPSVIADHRDLVGQFEHVNIRVAVNLE